MPAATPDWIRTAFINLLSDPGNSGAPVKETREKLRGFLIAQKSSHLLPGIDWAYKCKRDWDAISNGPPWRDQRWNLGRLDSEVHRLSAVALHDLLDLSVMCDLLGTSFTCRHASWAAKLVPIIPVSMKTGTLGRLDWLRFWSTAYSLEEMRSESYGVTPVDTTKLDFLIMADPFPFDSHFDSQGKRAITAQKMIVRLSERSGHVSAPPTWIVTMRTYLTEEVRPSDPIHNLTLESADRVWLRHFIGVAEDLLKLDLNISEWRAVAAILDATPNLNKNPDGADQFDQAVEFTKTVIGLFVQSRFDDLFNFTEVELPEESQVYAHHNN